MNIIEALILGLTQGLTEWLPVSSSAHLTILEKVMGVKVPLFFDAVLHVASALVLLFFLRLEVTEILRSLSRSIRHWRSGERFSEALKTEQGARMAWFIVLGSIPTAIIGVALITWFETAFDALLLVGVALTVTGIILALTALVRKGGEKELGVAAALTIGTAQGIAVIPGISRLGTTISTGLFLGLDRLKAAKYSLLLAFPAILGLALVSFFRTRGETLSIDVVALCVAAASAMVIGFLALKILMFVISRARFWQFAPYCIIVGLAIAIVALS